MDLDVRLVCPTLGTVMYVMGASASLVSTSIVSRWTHPSYIPIYLRQCVSAIICKPGHQIRIQQYRHTTICQYVYRHRSVITTRYVNMYTGTAVSSQHDMSICI